MIEGKLSKEDKRKFSGVRGKNKISKCFGVYNYFLYYNSIRPKQDKYKLTWKEHSDIIHAVHLGLREELFKNGYIEFPYNIGSLVVLRWKDKFVRFKDGEVKLPCTYVVDWDKTHKLWFEDKEAYNNRTLIRFEVKNMFNIAFKKKFGSYKNQSYYKFQIVRNLKKEVATKAKNNTLDNFFIDNG